MRRAFFILILMLVPTSHAATIYFAPSSAGSNNGTSCANAYAWTDATHGINNTTNSQVAGNTLIACSGTYTCSGNGASGIIIGASGLSGNIILIQAQSGAVFTCGYWGNDPVTTDTAAAIFCN